MIARHTKPDCPAIGGDRALCTCAAPPLPPVGERTEKPPQLEVRAAEPRGLRQKLNKTEAAYGQLLDADPEVKEWWAQSVTLLLAPDLRYTPDFFVVRSTGALEFHEVKGFERDDARDKFKMAAEIHWWATFIMVRREKGVFNVIRKL